jgi:2-keto-4-pentenoate hydratase/2-oxohepta-3-ene-1,7-dioic acid hydratase in catechol pathway
LKFLPPIPDPSKFFCVGKNNRKHREELAANKMLTEVPNEPTGFIKLVSTMSGDGDEVVKPDDITTLDYEPELCYVVGKRAHGVKKADAMEYISGFTLTNDVSARNPETRGRLRQPVLDRQEHAGLRAGWSLYFDDGRSRRYRQSVGHL